MKLELGPEDYSPALVRKIVRHGGKDPFEEASVDLGEDVGINVTPKQVQRLTERVGAEWAAQRDREVVAFRERRLPRLYSQAPEVAAVMPDGGRLQTRESGSSPGVRNPRPVRRAPPSAALKARWREPKYGCCLTLDTRQHRRGPHPEPPGAFRNPERVARLVGEVAGRAAVPTARTCKKPPRPPDRPKRRRRPRPRRRTSARYLVRTAVATMRPSDDFGELLAMEAYRRPLDRASRKAYVGDGEQYNWSIWAEHFQSSGFVPILDFVHLLSYVYQADVLRHEEGGGRLGEGSLEALRAVAESGVGRRALEAPVGSSDPNTRETLQFPLTRAKAASGKPAKSAPESDPRRIIASACTYVTNNIDKMDYPRYRKLGLPTSSAPVESRTRQFNRRVKGTEKFWTEEGAEAVLQVRAAYLSQDGRAERNWAMPRPRYRAVGRNRLALVS